MNKYTIKYILRIIGVILFAFAAVAILIALEELGRTWISIVIFATCLASIVHIVASIIYDMHKDLNSNLNVSKTAIGIVFMISSLCQIIYTFVIIIEAYRNFGGIHLAEYFIAAVFMLASAYFYKKSAYKLINKENKNEK